MSSYFAFTEQSMPEGSSNNPQMHIITNTSSNAKSMTSDDVDVFMGKVWLQPVHQEGQFSIIDVTFSPCARTNWHSHEKGQLLRVTTGSGWICDKGGKPSRIRAGDIVWCPPGTIHWHGADDGTVMAHQAVSIGKVEWYQAVSEEEYKAKEKP